MFTALVVLALSSYVSAEQNCFYTNSSGTIVSVNSLKDIPGEYLAEATCLDVVEKTPVRTNNYKPIRRRSYFNRRSRSNQRALRPEEVDLNRTERSREIITPLGPAEVRWEASAEKYLDKSIQKTVTTTMKAAARTLGQNSFPPDLRNLKYNWKILLMDRVPPEADIKVNGSGACHPGWMRYPADIYIAVERIATQCGRKRRSPSETSDALEETLVHEIGHAIEFKMLGSHYRRHERWHAEGFASWFESLAANFVTGRGQNEAEMRRRVKKAWNSSWRPQHFKGSWEDYARGYAMIATIADKASIRRLQQVYERASRENLTFQQAIRKELSWSTEDLYDKVESNFRLR